MITLKAWNAVLTAMCELNPYGKKLSPETIQLSYAILPAKGKEELNDGMLTYALQQHAMDPSPDKELPIDKQLLSHVYRMENEFPNFNWGLKLDLKERMAQANVFHGQPLSPYQLGEDFHKPDLEPCLPLGQLIEMMGAATDDAA